MKHLYHYILEVQTFIRGEVVQTSKFQIIFEIVWYASHNYLIELTIGDSQVMVVFHGRGLNHVYYKITMYLKTLCIIGAQIICQTRTICQALQVLDNYSSCFDSIHPNNHVSFKQKYYFMHFKFMIIIYV
jgi:hypothetical protein